VCKTQPDGREICEIFDCVVETAIGTTGGTDTTAGGTDGTQANPVECPPIDCPQALAEGDDGAEAPPAPGCTPPPYPEPVPVPEPAPVAVVLVDAERSLVLLPANDGSRDAYLVPAYRFTAEDSGEVDLPAVADEALAGSSSTETTVPDTVLPPPEPLPEPQPCEVLEEGDASGTTHTAQTCPPPDQDPAVLGEGEEPAVGVAYYVDIDLSCEALAFADALWWNDDGTVHGWFKAGETHEGGTFTLDSEDHGTFVGDAAGEKVAEFRRLQPNEDVFCTPEPRP
jgi:hypothetical protein